MDLLICHNCKQAAAAAERGGSQPGLYRDARFAGGRQQVFKSLLGGGSILVKVRNLVRETPSPPWWRGLGFSRPGGAK